MRRSSWLYLTIGVGILACCVLIFFLQPFQSAAPPMTNAVAEKIIEQGRRGLKNGDTRAIMDLMAPDARLLGKPLDEIRPALNTAISEVGAGGLTIKYGNLGVQQNGSRATVTFNMDVGQQTV